MSVFFILYMNKILLIRNDISYIIGNKGFTIIIVLHKVLGKSISHPRVKIYRDRSKRLLGFFPSNIHKVFMNRIYSIMYTMYEIRYSILTKIVSGYLQDLGENHWKVIIKYLRNTKDR